MSGLLDELLKENQEPEEKKPEAKGKFEYSAQFAEYVEKEKTAVGGENKGE